MHLPVMGQFSFGTPQVRGYLGMGGYMGYWLHSHRKGVDINFFRPWGSPDVNDESSWYYYDECYGDNRDAWLDRAIEFIATGR